MELSSMDRLSVLACISGLVMVLAVFAARWLGTSYPEWLPMAVASIAGSSCSWSSTLCAGAARQAAASLGDQPARSDGGTRWLTCPPQLKP